MKKWTMLAACTAVLALSVAGCADQPVAPQNADAERSALLDRASELKAEVVAEGRMTPELSRELEELTVDISAWRSRTGRTDLGFKRKAPGDAQSVPNVAYQIKGTPSSPCGWCPPVKVMGDLICFLEAKPDCGSGKAATCTYVCIVAS